MMARAYTRMDTTTREIDDRVAITAMATAPLDSEVCCEVAMAGDVLCGGKQQAQNEGLTKLQRSGLVEI